MNTGITKDMFERIPQDKEASELIARPSIGFWKDVWRRLRQNKVAMIALCILALLIIMVIVGPYFNKYEYNRIDAKTLNIKPNGTFWFGTDSSGRDIFTRVWVAGRTSLAIGLLAALVSTSISIIYGSIAGFVGGTVDTVMMRIVEILSSIPYLLLVILLQIRLNDRSLTTMLLALTITGWTGTARMVRGEVLRIRSREYIAASRVLGVSNFKIILKHLIPNALPLVIVSITFSVPGFMFAEAFLSYLGIGLAPPATSWGVMCSEANLNFMFYPYQLIFPTLMIALTMLSFTLLGDGLRDAIDPKLRK